MLGLSASGPRRPAVRRAAVAACALGLLFAASGCLRLDLGLEIRPDDTVGGTYTVAWSDEVLAEPGALGVDRSQLDAFSDALLEGVPGVEVGRTAYREDGFSGETVTFTDSPLDEFTEFGGDDWGYLRIDHSGREYDLEGYWDLRAAGFLDSGAFEDAEIRISVNFPAAVTEHNGTLDGRTVTWTMRPGDDYELKATAVANDGWAFLVAGVAAVVVILAVVWLLQWRALRRHSVGRSPAHSA